MSEEGPKLFTNKPKKSKLKQFQEASPSSSGTAASSYAVGSQTYSSTAPPPPPPQLPKESFARRYKFLWPLLLTVNLGVGAYLFMRTNNKKETTEPEEDVTKTATSAPASTTVAAAVVSPTIVEPVKVREPIPEDKQRELLQWVLEEKRKIKPKDSEEKKQINEDKALLKQLIRAKSIPTAAGYNLQRCCQTLAALNLGTWQSG
ncbi:hypothetical protein ACFE04_003904 [Oxalis oulophora]